MSPSMDDVNTQSTNQGNKATSASRSSGTAPLVVGLAGIVVGALVVYLGGALLVAVGGASSADSPRPGYPLLIVVVGAVVGIAVPLVAIGWYLRRRVSLAHQPHRIQALPIGLVWGAIATLLAGTFNAIAVPFPGGEFYPGLIEEFLKLLLPVILLVSTRAYSSPRLGVWLVFVVAAWLGLLEGFSYMITGLDPILDGGDVPPDAAFILMMDVLIRVMAEVSHPLITVGAAVLIWLAAKTMPKGKAVGVGILAYLGAAAIHGLNDAVIDGPVRDWNLPVSLVLTAVYVVAILVFWFRVQVRRLQEHSDATPTSVA
jgi:hypothetical protein